MSSPPYGERIDDLIHRITTQYYRSTYYMVTEAHQPCITQVGFLHWYGWWYRYRFQTITDYHTLSKTAMQCIC
jgi:hypothetical protein